MKNRGWYFLLGAVCGLVLGSLVGMKAGVDLRTSVNEKAGEALAQKRDVLAAASDLEPGTVLSKSNLVLRKVMDNDFPPRLIESTTETNSYLGRRVAVFVRRSDPISWDYLETQ